MKGKHNLMREFKGRDQEGATILITLLFMCLLAIMGSFAIETAMMQHHIVRNEKLHRKHFYLAEAAAVEGMQLVENEKSRARLIEKEAVYLNEGNPENENYVDLEDLQNWHGSDSGQQTAQTINDPRSGNLAGDAMFALSDKGVAGGASLSMCRSNQLHDYWVYGMCQKGNSPILIKIGYRKRY